MLGGIGKQEANNLSNPSEGNTNTVMIKKSSLRYMLPKGQAYIDKAMFVGNK